jgi:predicted RNA binding protein YcfA (HicA-like mRNA interferase family)
MNDQTQTVTVRIKALLGEIWTLPIEPYVTLREFVTSIQFLEVTKLNPNKLEYFVNNVLAKDDLLLLPGDVIEVIGGGEKALITPRDVIKKIKKLKGFTLHRHGGNHDIWRTDDGRTVPFPRHAGDLAIGTLKSILKEAGIDLSIDEFISK